MTLTNIPDKIPWAIFSLHPGSGSFSFSSVATVTPVRSFGRPTATFSLRLITSDPVPSEPCQRNHMLHSYYERTQGNRGTFLYAMTQLAQNVFTHNIKTILFLLKCQKRKVNKHDNFITNELLVSTKIAAQIFLRHKKKIAK